MAVDVPCVIYNLSLESASCSRGMNKLHFDIGSDEDQVSSS